HYGLGFYTRRWAKHLSPKDFANDAENGGNVMKPVMEKMTGGVKYSVERIGETKIRVQHREKINPSLIGSRGRKIDSVFVETTDGERFKMPSNNLNGARAMARHIENGGKYFDEKAESIKALMDKSIKLERLNSHIRENYNKLTNIPESKECRSDIKECIRKINEKLRRLSGSRGYGDTIDRIDENLTSSDIAAINMNVEKIVDLLGNSYISDLDECIVELAKYRSSKNISESAAEEHDYDELLDISVGLDRDDVSNAILSRITNMSLREAIEYIAKHRRMFINKPIMDAELSTPKIFSNPLDDVKFKLALIAETVFCEELSNYISSLVEKMDRKELLSLQNKKFIAAVIAISAHVNEKMNISTKPSIAEEISESFSSWTNRFDPKFILTEKSQYTMPSNGYVNSFDVGDVVDVTETPELNKSAFPLANWIKGKTTVTMVDPIDSSSLNTARVELSNGSIKEIYGFNIVGGKGSSSNMEEDKIWEIAMETVKWKDHPDMITSIMNKLSMPDRDKILKHVKEVWFGDIYDKISKTLMESSMIIVEKSQYEFSNTDLIVVDSILDNENINYEIDWTNSKIEIADSDKDTFVELMKKNKIKLDEQIIGGDQGDDFMRDISMDYKSEVEPLTTPTGDDNFSLFVEDRDDALRAMDELDRNNIKYDYYPNDNKFTFTTSSVYNKALSILRDNNII
ncbi:MAG: hypothetical protein WC284_19110, partial [Candidimonas sp.]